jgi:hypothetical protein
MALAKILVDLNRDVIGIADDHEIPARLPEPQHRVEGASLTKFEEHLVAREVFFRADQRQIATLHALVSFLSISERGILFCWHRTRHSF